MAKGFSFVLVTVVMIMMLVFGMLSFSSASADIRLSQKAAAAQQVYYELDSRGECLRSACAQAVAQADLKAENFMAQKLYEKSLPADFYSCLKPLAENPGASGSKTYNCLKRGIFFYELKKQLANIKGNFTISCAVDQKKLASALNSNGGSALPIVSVYSTIKSTTSPRNSLKITLKCDFGNFRVAPKFRTEQWQSSVSGLEISDSQTVHVWGGN